MQDTITRLIRRFYINLDLNSEDQLLLKYSINLLLGTIIKLLIIFCILVFLNCKHEFLYITLLLLTLRTYSGGIHFETFWGCTLFSVIYYLIVVFFNSLFVLQNIPLIYITSLIIHYIYSPVLSSTRPEYSKKQIRKFKHLSILIITTYHILFIIFGSSEFINISFWAIILNNIQLIFGKEVNKYEKDTIISKS